MSLIKYNFFQCSFSKITHKVLQSDRFHRFQLTINPTSRNQLEDSQNNCHKSNAIKIDIVQYELSTRCNIQQTKSETYHNHNNNNNPTFDGRETITNYGNNTGDDTDVTAHAQYEHHQEE